MNKWSEEKLRFAPLIRVSTEKQEKKGESLLVQKERILQSVESLGGVIPNSCWQYSGQEHATPEQERNKFQKLLNDSGKNRFDAVIVCDLSRWSRDNRASKDGLEILQSNNIKFYLGASEIDLYEPEQKLFIGMSTEINEFQAKMQSQKSMYSRIARAKKGIPTSGKLPYGRTYDKKTGQWGVDEPKKEAIIWAASEYLKGKSMGDIATTLGMNHPNLWKILTQRAGDEWEQTFQVKHKISQKVEFIIPRLLSQKTIDAIHAKAQANKTYTHGHIKYKYLLARMVICEECGNAMFGQTNHSQIRYYRHARNRKKECNKSLMVPAMELEDAVLVRLFKMYGNKKAIEEAIQRAIPDKEKLMALEKQNESLINNRNKVNNKISRLVDAVADGLIPKERIQQKNSELEKQVIFLTEQIESIIAQIEQSSSINSLRQGKNGKFSSLALDTLIAAYERLGALSEMSYEYRRHLLQFVFDGKDSKGKRLGVYVKKINGEWTFTINGILKDIFSSPYQKYKLNEGILPMKKTEMDEILDIEREYVGKAYNPLQYNKKEYEKIKSKTFPIEQDLLSKRHAYYSFSIYQRR